MADLGSSLFNKKATEKLRSPDDLDKYVRVTNPSIWVILVACITLLIGLLMWGVFGTVSTNVRSTSVYVHGDVISFLDTEKAAEVHEGDDALVSGERMKVAEISTIPLSRDEAKVRLDSDYLVSALVEGDWAYLVRFEGDDPYTFQTSRPLPTVITTERIAPLSLVLGKQLP